MTTKIYLWRTDCGLRVFPAGNLLLVGVATYLIGQISS